jgi:predicted NBD/HSP70 family sugar kinase
MANPSRRNAHKTKSRRDVVIKKEIMARQESEILRLTRRPGGASRIQIAKAMQMSPSAIAPYVERLLAEGYLVEASNAGTGPGRPAKPLTPSAKAGCFLGVDIGLRFVRILRVDFAQQIESRTRYEVGRGCTKSDILSILTAGLKAATENLNAPLLGCGIAVNGPIDPQRGVSLCWEEVEDWRDVPLKQLAEDVLGVPVLLESNNHCLALSELWNGKGIEEPTFLCISARMTVGATLVVDGKLWNGASGNSGLIGSWQVPSRILPKEARLASERPFRENYGIPLIQVASTEGVLSRVREAIRSGQESLLAEHASRILFDFLPVYRAFEAGDPVVRTQFLAAAKALGWVAGELAKLFDVHLIVISGLRLMGPLIVDEIRTVAFDLLGPPQHLRPRIVASDLFEFASAQGAVSLLIHHWGPRLELSAQPASPLA